MARKKEKAIPRQTAKLTASLKPKPMVTWKGSQMGTRKATTIQMRTVSAKASLKPKPMVTWKGMTTRWQMEISALAEQWRRKFLATFQKALYSVSGPQMPTSPSTEAKCSTTPTERAGKPELPGRWASSHSPSRSSNNFRQIETPRLPPSRCPRLLRPCRPSRSSNSHARRRPRAWRACSGFARSTQDSTVSAGRLRRATGSQPRRRCCR